MAVTLDQDQQQVTWSFPIIKMEDEDGDLRVFGKCTDGSVDRDLERIDVTWSESALKSWLDTGGNVRLQHDAKRPVGKGLKLDFSPDGHYLTALVVDPLAKELVRKGVLTAYSVGITRPDFTPDPTGKATRIITGRKDGQTEIAEVSLVDRPSNRNCGITIAKRAADGSPDYVEEIFGADGYITKTASEEDAPVTVDLPKTATVTFSPADLAKLLEHRRVAEQRQTETAKYTAETAVYKRDIDTATRRRLAKEGRALPDGSYPIENHKDAGNAVTLALSGHGNVSAAKKLIRRIARKEGWDDIIERLDGKKKPGAEKAAAPAKAAKKCKLCHGTGKIRDGEMECPRCHGDGIRSPGEPDEHGKSATPEGTPVTGSTAAKGAPRALRHDDGRDDDSDSDADAMDKNAATPETPKADMAGKKPKTPCPKCKAMMKPKAKFCGKCGTPMTTAKAAKPTPADHATGTAARDIQPAPEHREPDGPVVESFEHDAGLPTVPDSSVKTAMHMRDLGVPREQGMLHDLLCPAYGDTAVKAAWPGADLSLADEQAWQAKALEIAATAPLEEAQEASKIWQAAITVKSIPPDLYGDVMADARKAFRDANPGPGTAPQPGELSAQRFNRPYITAGHSAPSPDHGAPHTSPIQPGHISASDFHRGLITEGHAADAPENSPSRPEPVPAPAVPGVPSRVYYSNTQRANARQAMAQMHDHIAATFPDLCPMHGPGRAGEPAAGARPVAAGIGAPVPHRGKSAKAKTRKAPKVNKAAKKEQRKLVTRVVKGTISVEEARARLGITPDGPGAPDVAKAATPGSPAPVAPAMAAPLDPDLIKAAVAEAVAPLQAHVARQDKALRKQARLLDAIADQPDPAVTAYRGAALTKGAQTTTAPAGPVGIQQRAALAQETLIRDREDIARNSPDPSQRVQAMWDLMNYHGLTGGHSPMT